MDEGGGKGGIWSLPVLILPRRREGRGSMRGVCKVGGGEVQGEVRRFFVGVLTSMCKRFNSSPLPCPRVIISA